jgi:hypothetical protein
MGFLSESCKTLVTLRVRGDAPTLEKGDSDCGAGVADWTGGGQATGGREAEASDSALIDLELDC